MKTFKVANLGRSWVKCVEVYIANSFTVSGNSALTPPGSASPRVQGGGKRSRARWNQWHFSVSLHLF